MTDNPYQPSGTTHVPRPSVNLWQTMAFWLACLLLACGGLFAWIAIELANQEYWHVWYRNSQLTDIQFGETVISAASLVNGLVVVVAIIWFLAFLCFGLARRRGRSSEVHERVDA